MSLCPECLQGYFVPKTSVIVRDGYNLLKIPNYEGSEKWIAEVLDGHEINDKKYIKYNGLVVIDNAVYVTFENFPSAHYMWDKWVNDKTTAEFQRNAVILKGSIRLKDKKDMYVSLKIDENKHAGFERAIYNKIKILAYRPKSKHTYRNKQQSTTDPIDIFYKFDMAYPAIRFYSLCKKENLEMVRFWSEFEGDLIQHDADAVIFPLNPPLPPQRSK